MNVRSIMLVAGEPSGDLLAAELVNALRPHFREQSFEPRFFGAGGEHLAGAGVELVQEMTREAVVGLADVARSLGRYRRIFHRLLAAAVTRTPDLVVLVDFTGFNRRFAHALRQRVLRQSPAFANWRPRIVQYVSPQVWASRPGRAYAMAADLDLLLCLFPFERAWYARRLPHLRVECVGHPICDRYPEVWRAVSEGRALPEPGVKPTDGSRATAPEPTLLLLPGSRRSELRRHLPVMLEAARRLVAKRTAEVRIVLPGEALRPLAEELIQAAPPAAGHGEKHAGERLQPVLQCGGLAEALRRARVAIASTGTVTLECALFGVPTVALYQTNWITYQIARRLVTVDYMAMPNILAGREVFPEFIQDRATPDNLAQAALDLWRHKKRRAEMRSDLRRIVRDLGGPGAARRAADQIARLLQSPSR